MCLAGVVWLVLYGINKFVTPIPARLEQGIWFVVLILIIIGALTILAGGGFRRPFPGPVGHRPERAPLPMPQPAPDICNGC